MVARVKAVLDACVLYPAALRDTLLRVARAGFYDAYWSEQILEEVRRNLTAEDLSLEQWHHLRNKLTVAFPEAIVTGHEHLIDTMPNHPKDRHVLAAAVAAGAQVIVTSNLRDFPEAALKPFSVEALSPDAFLVQLFRQDSNGMTQVVVDQAHDLRRPPKSVSEVLDMLAKHAPNFAACVRKNLER